MAQLGHGAKFCIKNGSGYPALAKVTTIKPPGLSRDAVDVTDMDTPDKARAFLGGLVNGGTAGVTVNFVPSAAHALMTAFMADEGEFRIIFPKGDFQMDFTGVPTNFQISDTVIDDKMTATFDLQVSGLPVISAVTEG